MIRNETAKENYQNNYIWLKMIMKDTVVVPTESTLDSPVSNA